MVGVLLTLQRTSMASCSNLEWRAASALNILFWRGQNAARAYHFSAQALTF